MLSATRRCVDDLSLVSDSTTTQQDFTHFLLQFLLKTLCICVVRWIMLLFRFTVLFSYSPICTASAAESEQPLTESYVRNWFDYSVN